jgi:O-antigen ligase
MGMTRSLLPGGGDIVNHFSYLQMWADTGLLGFVSYVGLIFGLAAQAVHRLIQSVRTMSKIRARAAFTGVYLLLCWAMACVFHAVSSELSEWLMYLAGLALVSNMLRSPLDIRSRLARLLAHCVPEESKTL